MKFDVDDKNRCQLVCKISFKSVQVCGGCCKMFRGLTFLGHSVVCICCLQCFDAVGCAAVRASGL